MDRRRTSYMNPATVCGRKRSFRSSPRENLHGHPVRRRFPWKDAPRDDGPRRAQPDLPKDFRLVLAGFQGGHEDDGMADVLGEGSEPGRGVGFLHREEASMLRSEEHTSELQSRL